MKFQKHFPCERLRPYIRYFVVSENTREHQYKVFPSPGLVAGFQYKGQLSMIEGHAENKLASSGITGISDRYKIFKSSPDIGTILVYFTETGFIHFSSLPANELFSHSISLDHIFDHDQLVDTEEQLAMATSDQLRVEIIEQFFLSRLKEMEVDNVIVEAVRLLYQSKGTIRIRELNDKLCISASPFEKRFRKVVGTSPKKFASIIRFNTVLADLARMASPADVWYESNFFDQAHFIKDFRQFTGDTPASFKRLS